MDVQDDREGVGGEGWVGDVRCVFQEVVVDVCGYLGDPRGLIVN